jgi:hypothetical protein
MSLEVICSKMRQGAVGWHAPSRSVLGSYSDYFRVRVTRFANDPWTLQGPGGLWPPSTSGPNFKLVISCPFPIVKKQSFGMIGTGLKKKRQSNLCCPGGGGADCQSVSVRQQRVSSALCMKEPCRNVSSLNIWARCRIDRLALHGLSWHLVSGWRRTLAIPLWGRAGGSGY